MTYSHPTPWTVRWTDFGESMGYDSQSAIYDANGAHIATIGRGDDAGRGLAEFTAQQIVSAVNARYTPSESPTQ